MNTLDFQSAMERIAQLENENNCLKQESADLKEQIEKTQESYERMKNQLQHVKGYLEYRSLQEENWRLQAQMWHHTAMLAQRQLELLSLADHPPIEPTSQAESMNFASHKFR